LSFPAGAALVAEADDRRQASYGTYAKPSTHRLRYFAYQIILLGVIVGAWQIVSTLRLLSPLIASSPGDVAQYLYKSSIDGELPYNFWVTFEATLIAFALSAVVGTLIGMALGLMPRVERIVNPYITALNAMPRIALAPVFIIYFGIDTEAKVALAFSFVVFPFIINTRAGIRNADYDVIRMARSFGANKRELLTKVLVPTALPSIFASLRLGIVYSFLGVVTSELITARAGLGQLIQEYSGSFQIGNVYGILIVLAVVASFLNFGMGLVEQRLLRWQEPLQ